MSEAFNRRMNNLKYGDVVRPLRNIIHDPSTYDDPTIMVIANSDIFSSLPHDPRYGPGPLFVGMALDGPKAGSITIALRDGYERVPSVRSLMGTKGWDYAAKVFNEQMKIRGIIPND